MIPEPDFTGIDDAIRLHGANYEELEDDVTRLNEERIRLRKWLNFLMQWARDDLGDPQGPGLPSRPPLTLEQIEQATSDALSTGDYPPLM